MDDQAHDPVARAREQGRAAAEAFDAALRAVEDRERAERSAALASGAASDDPWAGHDGESAPTEVARLRSQVEALASFRVAVLSSKAWRFIQAARRLFGRAW